MTQIAAPIDGKSIAAQLRASVRQRAQAFAQRHGRPPSLSVTIVGNHPPSEVYVRNKALAAKKADIHASLERLPAKITQPELEAHITALGQDAGVDGILLQLPLPDVLDADAAIAKIPASKDVDGLTEASQGRLALARPGLRSCTPAGCVTLAKRALGDDLSGRNVVVVGRSILVGRPAAQLFLLENCTVTIAHSRTHDVANVCRSADILIAAVGRPEMIQGDWIKPGACVIDVGINRIDDPASDKGYRLVGDVDYHAAQSVAGSITPVPGGVGPMTIAHLLANTVQAAELRHGDPATPVTP